MNSMGSGGEDDSRCPQCRQFVKNAELIVGLMDDAECKTKDLIEDLHKFEWTIMGNAQNVRDMRKNGMELDKESFEVAFKETKRFLRFLESVNSGLNSMRRNFNDISNYDNQTLGDVRE